MRRGHCIKASFANMLKPAHPDESSSGLLGHIHSPLTLVRALVRNIVSEPSELQVSPSHAWSSGLVGRPSLGFGYPVPIGIVLRLRSFKPLHR